MAIIDNATYRLELEMQNLPETYDPRADQSIEIPVIKDQGRAPMCYSVSTTDSVALGLHMAGIHPQLIPLSSKEVFDCAYDNMSSYMGKSGGIKQAFRYIRDRGALREIDYPFAPTKCPCKARTEAEEQHKVTISGFVGVDAEDEFNLMRSVYQWPVVAAVPVSEEFKRLGDEIYMADVQPNQASFKHAIMVIGWGYDEARDMRYWIIRNSYGVGWGNEGYARVARKSSLPGGINLFRHTYQALFG